MQPRQRRYPAEVLAERGNEIYRSQIRPHLKPEDKGKIVAIDIDSGAFEVADSTLAACHRLIERYPDAQIWGLRVGYVAVHSFGGRRIPEEP